MATLTHSVDPRFFQELYLDTTLEYDMDMSEFPGIDDPRYKYEPALLVQLRNDKSQFEEEGAQDYPYAAEYEHITNRIDTHHDDMQDEYSSDKEIISLLESGELERQLADTAFLDYLWTLGNNDNSGVTETSSANNHTSFDTIYVEHVLGQKWTHADYGYSSSNMKNKKRKSEDVLNKHDYQKHGHNCLIKDMAFRPPVISSPEHDVILVGRYS